MHSVIINGESVDLVLSDCKVSLTGEMAGNVDLKLTSNREIPEKKMINSLELRLPESGETLELLGTEPIEDGIEVTFFSEYISGSSPQSLEAFWIDGNEQSLGKLNFVIIEEDEEEAFSGPPSASQFGCAGNAAMILLLTLFGISYFVV